LAEAAPPVLALNSLAIPTEQSEQKGFARLLIGLVGLYRNPVAHDPRTQLTISDAELLEVLLEVSGKRLATAE
jgi:uncharacterized protein (TIGR02391 family)